MDIFDATPCVCNSPPSDVAIDEPCALNMLFDEYASFENNVKNWDINIDFILIVQLYNKWVLKMLPVLVQSAWSKTQWDLKNKVV